MSGRRPRVYLAGPIAGCNERQRTAWRAEARDKLGREFDIVDPVETTQGEDHSPAAIVERDRRAIRECDAMLANMRKESIGTAMGIVHAWTEARVLVVADPNHLGSRLVQYYADDVTESLGDAVKSLKQILRAEASIRSVLKRSGKVEPFQRRKIARAIRRACWEAGLDDVSYPAPVRRDVLAALLRHGADVNGAVTTSTIEDCVLTVLRAMERRTPEYAKVRERWQGYLEKRRPSVLVAGAGAPPGEPRVFPLPQRITVSCDKSHGTIWGKKVSRLADIPEPARSAFRAIAQVEYVRQVRLTQFHGTAAGSSIRVKFLPSDTADVIEGHCADPTARLPKVQHFQVLLTRPEEKAGVLATLERHVSAAREGRS